MKIEFDTYDAEETDVYVYNGKMSREIFIAIENDDGAEAIRIYMSSEDEVQNFINKLQKSLDKRKNKKIEKCDRPKGTIVTENFSKEIDKN